MCKQWIPCPCRMAELVSRASPFTKRKRLVHRTTVKLGSLLKPIQATKASDRAFNTCKHFPLAVQSQPHIPSDGKTSHKKILKEGRSRPMSPIARMLVSL